MMSSPHDVVVIGGGPAGASVAIRLTQLGYRVRVFDQRSSARQHVAESLPSSLRVVLRALGLALPDEIHVERPSEHRVYWGASRGASLHDVPRGEESLLVWRGAFDDFLRRAAIEAGVQWVDGRMPAEREPRAGFLIDASGRTGAHARERGWREHEAGFQTLALTGHFSVGAEMSSAPTVIEAFEDGFVWSAPLRNGLRDVTVFVDAGAKLTDFDAHVRRAPHVSALVDGTARAGAVLAADATPYRSRRYGDEALLLVGDAASSLDPLSSHGVHKAMDGGLTAAAVVRTMIERPSSREDALSFYAERESSIVGITATKMARLYASEARFASRPFWRKRSRSEAEPSPWASPAAAPPPRSPLTRATRLAPADGVAVIEAPVLEDDYIVRREVLVAPGKDRAVRYLGEHCLPDLYREVLDRGLDAMLREPGRGRIFEAVDWLYRSGYLEPLPG